MRRLEALVLSSTTTNNFYCSTAGCIVLAQTAQFVLAFLLAPGQGRAAASLTS